MRAFSEIASEALGAGEIFLNPVNEPAVTFLAASDCSELDSSSGTPKTDVDMQKMASTALERLENMAMQDQAAENENLYFHITAAGVCHLDMQRHAFQRPALAYGINTDAI